jgi:hypothetical protein
MGNAMPVRASVKSKTFVTSIQSHQTRNGKKKNPNSCATPARIPSRAYQRGTTAVRGATAEVAQTTTELRDQRGDR